MKATEFQKNYYQLSENATLRDVFLSVRADESVHRDVNHKVAALKGDFDTDR